MVEPIIRVKDIAWIRLKSPDLSLAEEYLTDFGLRVSEKTPEALYMRGTDERHHIHITEKGGPAVARIAFWARREEDLYRLSKEAEGASAVESLDEPGGGKRVRLAEYNGLGLEVVWGVESVAALPIESYPLNFAYSNKNARVGRLLRVSLRPSRVKRIGHVVISTPDVARSAAWAHRHLGFVRSDDVHLEGDPHTLVASFNRIDDGEGYVDHHVVMFGRLPTAGLNHVSFEVQDLDDLAIGHELLMQKYPGLHVWGLGRHTLGSQIFDYWQDPWGRQHEHWTDSDVLNCTHPFQVHTQSKGLRSQWGPQAPQIFRNAASR